MNVLYVNHTGTLGGAERSLLGLLAVLPENVHATVLCPDGPLADEVDRLGVRRGGMRGVNGGMRLDVRHTPTMLARFAADALTIRRHARRAGVDLVHANSIRAGIASALAGAPTIVTVRDCLPPTRIAALTRAIVHARATLLLANSSYTAASFAPAGNSRLRVVHPPIDLARFDPRAISRAGARERLGLPADAPVLGVVGQLTPWKAQDDAIRTLAYLRERYPDARLVLAGTAMFDHPATRFDNLDYERRLRALAAELEVGDAVEFLGFREDVPEIMRSLDLLLCPSWEEPFGRSVVEAMAMEVPVLATRVGGPAEVIADGIDGLLLPPRSPELWADAAAALLEDREGARDIGRAARQRAQAFSREAHLASVLSAYRSVVA